MCDPALVSKIASQMRLATLAILMAMLEPPKSKNAASSILPLTNALVHGRRRRGAHRKCTGCGSSNKRRWTLATG
jgi:hypothetical protein